MMCCDYQSLCGWWRGTNLLAIHAACWRDLALPIGVDVPNADAFFPASMMRNLALCLLKQLIPNEPARKSLAFADRIQKVVMDYRIGITGAQAVGKQPWLNISTNITESLTWCWCRKFDEPPRCSSRWFYALYERLQIQMEIAKHIELLTRVLKALLSIAHLLMLWPTRWIGRPYKWRSVYWVSPRYRKVCHKTAISNFNAIAGLRPGVASQSEITCGHNEHH